MAEARISPSTNPDPHALAVAQEVHRAVRPDAVILYGSRARGDHRPDSDIDLMVIRIGPPSAQPEPNPPVPESPHDVNILVRNPHWFQRGRRARNHVTARALREGVVFGGEALHIPIDTGDGYPDGWPDVKHNLESAHDYLHVTAKATDVSPAARGECIRHATEHALRAWISAVDLDYPITKNITDLGNIIISSGTESAHPVAHHLRRFLGYISESEGDGGPDMLTRYAVWEDRGILNRSITRLEMEMLVAEAHGLATAIIGHVHDITGTSQADLNLVSYRDCQSSDTGRYSGSGFPPPADDASVQGGDSLNGSP